MFTDWDLNEFGNGTNDTSIIDDVVDTYGVDGFKTALHKFKSAVVLNKPRIEFMYIDSVLLIIFGCELFLRLLCCPSLKQYFSSIINLLDIGILVSAIAELLIVYFYEKHRYQPSKALEILFYFQMLRVIRIFRFVQHMTCIRVLCHTFRSGYKDLFVLLITVIIGIVIFANFTYFAENKLDFENIPATWWWAVITMTTVGYGDMVPKTVLGRIIGSVCALSGVLVLSLTVPIFVNTFISFYQFSRIHDQFMTKQRPLDDENKLTPRGQPFVTKVGDVRLSSEEKGPTDAKHCVIERAHIYN